MKPTLFFLAGCVVAAGCSAVKPVPVVTPVAPPEHNGEADIARFQQGSDFVATGNEPSWILEVDFDSAMMFKSFSDQAVISTPVPPSQLVQDEKVTRYRGVGASVELIVQIEKKECHDSMADETFPYGVSVDVKHNAASDYKTFKGCGRYLVDYKLHDLWVLKELGEGVTVTEKDYPREHPRMELNPGQLAALWMIGFEDEPDRSGEITIMEIFGEGIDETGTELGHGIKAVNDPRLVTDFIVPRLPFSPERYHTYRADWDTSGVSFYLNGQMLRRVDQSPAYPMQFMLNVYELRPTDAPPPRLCVDWFRAYRLI